MKIKWKPLLISMAIAFGAELLSDILTMNNMKIYKELPRPVGAPPGWLFPIVWTILFFLMGLSVYRISQAHAPATDKQRAYILYGIQLFFNIMWTVIFFNMQAFLFSFIWIVALWILIAAMIAAFFKVDALAAWLQFPYLLWTIFAAYLNFSIFIMIR